MRGIGHDSIFFSVLYANGKLKMCPGFFPYVSHNLMVAAAAKSLQSCPTLSDPMDCSPPGSSVHGIFRARVLEWGAMAFSETNGYVLQ